MIRPRLHIAACTLGLMVAACGSQDKNWQPFASITQKATFVAGGSIGQVWVTDAKEGDDLVLVDENAVEIARGSADRLGSHIFRGVKPGPGYTVRLVKGSEVDGTDAFRVLSRDDVPDPSLYQQTLVQGLNYVKMRDGIELAMTVRLPAGDKLQDGKITDGNGVEVGPLPTIIEYSGYQVAAPHDLLSAVAASIAAGTGLNTSGDPLLPDTSTAVGSLIAPILGFAAVSVQMRGSGCSGGDFQLFDVPTTYDGYDAVETVAAQPWVKGGVVGMGGISFSGISQLFVGGTRPPHLAGLTPMSFIDHVYSGIGFPGGIFNDGFAKSWLRERGENAHPAPEAGAQPYAIQLVNDGDQHCTDNQKLRVQTQDVERIILDHPYRDPELTDDRSPSSWVDKIEAPVFAIGEFQDEQTGPHFPEMFSKMDGNPNVWFSLQNGVHCDALGPATFSRWVEFLNIFVAKQAPPPLPGLVSSQSAALYQAIASGSPSMPIPATRFNGLTADAAMTEFKKDPRVRLLLDSGSNNDIGFGQLGRGALQPGWETTFSAWPVKEAVNTTYYLGPNGTLSASQPAESTVSYVGNTELRPAQTLDGTGTTDSWSPVPAYNWAAVVDGAGLGFVTEALGEDTFLAGSSSLDLMVRTDPYFNGSDPSDTDIQVTISDVRPDGQEMYVQSGWLRASHRALDTTASTDSDPIHTDLLADGRGMPLGTFDELRVQIYPVAYSFRKGNKIRITIQAPGGERTRWNFQTIEHGDVQNTIQLGPSKLVLPIVPGIVAGAPLPPCPSNRGQPCRAYKVASNGG